MRFPEAPRTAWMMGYIMILRLDTYDVQGNLECRLFGKQQPSNVTLSLRSLN